MRGHGMRNLERPGDHFLSASPRESRRSLLIKIPPANLALIYALLGMMKVFHAAASQ